MGLGVLKATIHPNLAEASDVITSIPLDLRSEGFRLGKLQKRLYFRLKICKSINQQVKVFNTDRDKP